MDVTPSIRAFAQAIDRQRKSLERVPLLRVTDGLLSLAKQLDEAEASALAIEASDSELARFGLAARAVSIPVLRATVLSEEFRVFESRAAGADAVLLSAAAVPYELLARLVIAAKSTHMAACVICVSASELAHAVQAKAPIVVLPGHMLDAPPPPRTLVLAHFNSGLRGRADAALDPSFATAVDPAQAFRDALAADDDES
jgi:indole-3-glycerol phosphate synthase